PHPPHSPPFPTRRSSDLRLIANHFAPLTFQLNTHKQTLIYLYSFHGNGLNILAKKQRVGGVDAQNVLVARNFKTVAHPELIKPLDRKSTRLNSSHVRIPY